MGLSSLVECSHRREPFNIFWSSIKLNLTTSNLHWLISFVFNQMTDTVCFKCYISMVEVLLTNSSLTMPLNAAWRGQTSKKYITLLHCPYHWHDEQCAWDIISLLLVNITFFLFYLQILSYQPLFCQQCIFSFYLWILSSWQEGMCPVWSKVGREVLVGQSTPSFNCIKKFAPVEQHIISPQVLSSTVLLQWQRCPADLHLHTSTSTKFVNGWSCISTVTTKWQNHKHQDIFCAAI